jgi:hypothetical protein
MSKYFAKYLPVGGEIKEGNTSLKNGIRFFHHRVSQSDTFEGHQKVKLFLCSRDIQVGDEMTPIFGGNTFTVTEKSLIAIITSETSAKVIGEISPGATWVKEGDEFERNDFRVLWQNSPNGRGFARSETCEDFTPYLVVEFPCPVCKNYN